jgi:hypothetical protein
LRSTITNTIFADTQDRIDGITQSLKTDKDFKVTIAKLNAFIKHVESEIQRFRLSPAAPEWIWDDSRKSYYFWSSKDGSFIYQNGLKIRNGMEVEDEEEDEEEGDDDPYVVS